MHHERTRPVHALTRIPTLVWLVLAASSLSPLDASAQGSAPRGAAQAATDAEQDAPQTAIAPGVYSFQTRLDLSSCGQRITTGSVRTYVATVDGVPGSRELRMRLLGSDYWSRWTLHVTAEGYVVGDSQQDGVEGPARGDSHFELRLVDGKLSGRGSRSYTQRRRGQSMRCRVSYDALLLPLTTG
ncbi:MAG: hypothetical protein GXP55_03345 [Deltaproteobacteria bacterium]|nr:hypothetical protein [Deltaproteobacteria bacterium]